MKRKLMIILIIMMMGVFETGVNADIHLTLDPIEGQYLNYIIDPGSNNGTGVVMFSKVHSPYYVEPGNRGIIIKDGGTLVIEAGVELYFSGTTSWSGIKVEDGGTLIIEGTEAEPVTLGLNETSINPDWDGISFEPGSTGVINYVVISDAGHDGSVSTYYDAAIFIDEADVTIQNSEIQNSVGNGITIEGSTTTPVEFAVIIENNLINNTGVNGDPDRTNYPIRVHCYSGKTLNDGTKQSTVIRNNSGFGNTNNSIYLQNDNILFEDYQLYANELPYYSYGYDGFLTVKSGNKLTINEDVIMKFNYSRDGSGIKVDGGVLHILGSEGHEPLLTAYSDDIGGDTNNDGNSIETVLDREDNRGYWSGVRYLNGGSGIIDHAIFRYSGHQTFGGQNPHPKAAVYLYASEATVRNSTFEYCGSGIKIDEPYNSEVIFEPIIENNEFYDCEVEPIFINCYRGTPSIKNNSGLRNGLSHELDESDNIVPKKTGYNAINLKSNEINSENYILYNNFLAYYTYGYDGYLVVKDNKKLTIEAGTVIKFGSSRDGSGILVDSGGELIAEGNDNEPIILTAIIDDVYNPNLDREEDTNNDQYKQQEEATPYNGYWGGVRFTNGGEGSLCYTTIRYAGSRTDYDYKVHKESAVFIDESSPEVMNNLIEYATVGIRINADYNSDVQFSPTVENNIINDSELYGIYLGCLQGSPSIRGNSGERNGYTYTEDNEGNVTRSVTGANAIYIQMQDLKSADYILSANGLPYYAYGYNKDIVIDEGNKLTIEQGSIVKFDDRTSGMDISVDGGELVINGTTNEGVVLTSINDDEYGGDTNLDNDLGEEEVLPSKGDWGGISVINDGSIKMNYTDIRYAGGGNTSKHKGTAIYIEGIDSSTNPSNISYSSMSHSIGYGIKSMSSDLTIDSCQITDCDKDALTVSTDNGKIPLVLNTVAINNRSNGIQLGYEKSNILEGTTTLTKQCLPYVVGDMTVVPAESNLIIEPGVIVKFSDAYREYDRNLNIEGSIDVNGTVEEPVIFTTLKDDRHGGDTNSDGVESKPLDNDGEADWGSVSLREGSVGTFDYAWFMYGSYVYFTQNRKSGGMIFGTGATIDVNHCEFAHAGVGGSDSGNGIYIASNTNYTRTDLTVNNTVFNDMLRGVKVYNGAMNGSISNSSFHAIGEYSVLSADADNYVDARNNWWGAVNGPSGEGSGDGYPVSANVTYEPYLTSNPYECDFDFNRVINWLDLDFVIDRYSITDEDEAYDIVFDINLDGRIDILDIIVLTRKLNVQ